MPRIPDDLEPHFDRFISGPANVRQALQGLDAAALNRRPPAEDWSIRDIVIHLCDTEIMAAGRVLRIIAEDGPVLLPFDEGLFKRRLHYLWRDPELALALFQNLRYVLGELFQQCSPETWQRAGHHPDLGPQTLAGLLIRRADHSDEHTAQIRAFRELVER